MLVVKGNKLGSVHGPLGGAHHLIQRRGVRHSKDLGVGGVSVSDRPCGRPCTDADDKQGSVRKKETDTREANPHMHADGQQRKSGAQDPVPCQGVTADAGNCARPTHFCEDRSAPRLPTMPKTLSSMLAISATLLPAARSAAPVALTTKRSVAVDEPHVWCTALSAACAVSPKS